MCPTKSSITRKTSSVVSKRKSFPGPSNPQHVAIILDGNGRWAKKRRMPRVAGHKAGVENVREIVRHCVDRGINTLTLFAFSSENWQRPRNEIQLLLELFINSLEQEIDVLLDVGARLRVIGDREKLPENLRHSIKVAEQKTSCNKVLTLVVAANYGGRWDLVQAARSLAMDVAAGTLAPDEVNQEELGRRLCLADLPEPDLFIRPGGELRLSNYLLWQLAYSELYFTDCLWPDFGVKEFDKALDCYAKRERRFGRTGEQMYEKHEPRQKDGSD